MERDNSSARGAHHQAQRSHLFLWVLGSERILSAETAYRIYITKRSWLDGGTEVLPGDRKFTDYAFPPGYSFARQNGNRPLDRQPLNPPFDLSGYPLVMTPW
jgi:hypothetical protein